MKKIFIFMILMLSLMFGVNGALIDNNVQYLNFSSDVTNQVDMTGTQADAIEHATWTGSGLIDGAFDYGGGFEYMDTSFSTLSTVNTYSIWFKNTDTNTGMLYGVDGDQRLQLSTNYGGDGGFRFYTKLSSSTILTKAYFTETDWNDGTWHNLVIVHNLGTGSITPYFDGVENTGVTYEYQTGTSSLTLSGNIYLGANNHLGSEDNFYTGLIDEWSVWSEGKSQAEITQLYNSGSGNQYPYGTSITPSVNDFIQAVPETIIYTDGLVAYYTAQNNANDVIGGNNGTEYNGVSYTTDSVNKNYGSAFAFDGVDGSGTRIEAEHIDEVEVNKNFTVCLWMKSYDTVQSVVWGNGISSSNRLGLTWMTDGISFNHYNGATYDYAKRTYSLSLNTWYHVCSINENNNFDLTVNGAYSTTDAFIYAPYDDRFILGGQTSTTRNFNGEIDDVRIYNRSLSSDEITNLYNLHVSDYYYLESENLSIELTSDTNVNMSYVLDDSDLIVSDGLVAYYQAEGNSNDRLGLNNGTEYNGVTYSNSMNNYGQGFEFDGVDDYVMARNLKKYFGTNEIQTISLWVNINSYQTDKFIFSYPDTGGTYGNRIYYGISNGKIYVRHGSNTYTQPTIANLNQWYHIIGIRDPINNKHQVYINNILKEDDTSYYDDINEKDTFLGCLNAGSKDFNGSIDEVRIYNRSLNATEINTLYTTSPYINVADNTNSSTLDLYGVSEQGHEILFYGTDINGNTVSSSAFTIDYTKPNIQILNISDRLNAELDLTTVANITDLGSGIDICTFNIFYLENVSNSSQYDLIADCNETITLLANGKYRADIIAQDYSGNINTISINGTFAPYVYVFFNDSVTSTLVDNYIATVTYANGYTTTPTIQPDNSIIITPIINDTFMVGNVSINFKKDGWSQEDFSFEITPTVSTPKIFNITRTTLTIKMYDAVSLSQLTYDIVIINSTDTVTYTSQTNFSKLYSQVPTSDIEIHISSPGYADTTFYYTLNPLTSVYVEGYLYTTNITDVHTFTVEEFSTTQKLEDVLVEVQKLINGSYTTLVQKLTSSSGLVYYDLDKTKEYKVIFSKDGYVSSTATTIPGTLTYTVKLKTTTSAFEYIDTLSFSLTPTTDMLNDNTTYRFTGFISDTSLTQTSFTVEYENGTVLYNSISTNPTGNTFVYEHLIPANTNHTNIIVTLNYIKDGNSKNIVKEYNIISFTEGSFLKTFEDYGNSNSSEDVLLRWLLMMMIIASVIITGAMMGVPTVNLMIIPVMLGLTFVGWIDWVYSIVISFIALVMFIGGRR